MNIPMVKFTCTVYTDGDGYRAQGVVYDSLSGEKLGDVQGDQCDTMKDAIQSMAPWVSATVLRQKVPRNPSNEFFTEADYPPPIRK